MPTTKPFRLECLIDSKITRTSSHATRPEAEAEGKRHLSDDWRTVKRAAFRVVEIPQ